MDSIGIKAMKIGLSILLLLCLADMPYGFYQLVRFIALVCFAILAYQANERGSQTEMIIYASMALLFQPIFKIPLGRLLWNVVDVIVALGLLLSIFIRTKEKEE